MTLHTSIPEDISDITPHMRVNGHDTHTYQHGADLIMYQPLLHLHVL